MRKTFKLQNLECANCATKMESDINKIEGVEKASISFMTQKLAITADVDGAGIEAIVDQAQSICSKYEPDCAIVR